MSMILFPKKCIILILSIYNPCINLTNIFL